MSGLYGQTVFGFGEMHTHIRNHRALSARQMMRSPRSCGAKKVASGVQSVVYVASRTHHAIDRGAAAFADSERTRVERLERRESYRRRAVASAGPSARAKEASNR